MNFRIWAAPVLGLFCSLLAVGAHAQPVQQADYIVAVVNSEPITNSEVQIMRQRLEREAAARGGPFPARWQA